MLVGIRRKGEKMKYFVDNNIWFQGVRQPPRKVELELVFPQKNGKTAACYDKDGDEYILLLSDIFDADDASKGA